MQTQIGTQTLEERLKETQNDKNKVNKLREEFNKLNQDKTISLEYFTGLINVFATFSEKTNIANSDLDTQVLELLLDYFQKEKANEKLNQIGYKYLSYDSAYFEVEDIKENSNEYKNAFQKYIKNAPKSLINYAKEVQKLIDKNKIDEFIQLAKNLHQKYVDILLKLKIIKNKDNAINYNCFRWHIAKQLFLETKAPSHPDYPNANPLTDKITQEFMINVMIGWNYIQSEPNLAGEIDKIYKASKKDNKEIPSWAYARIGKILRESLNL